MAKAAASKKRVDPFKTRKTKTPTADVNDTLTPPDEVAQAIDAFREAQDQYKHYEGEMTLHKDQILAFSSDEYAKRLLNGVNGSFKILGQETMVTYVVMDSSAGLTEEDVHDFAQNWGKEAAEALIVRDYGSVRFDPSVLEANYDTVVEALQTLPEAVLNNLFKPMLMKMRPGAAELAKRYAKNPEDLKEILKQLKVKNYIR
ncbi:MAG: hypothetical protein HYX41_03500 [Bdellovibrio sp.]|nr:hypothetical protein [Bdellovibrio sp.]